MGFNKYSYELDKAMNLDLLRKEVKRLTYILSKEIEKKRILTKSLLILCAWMSVTASQYVSAKNSFLVAPGRVTFDLKKPTTQSFILTNNGDGKIRLSIKPVYFPIDSKSLQMGALLDPKTAELEDLTKYIRVAPRSLSLNPGQRRDIRISIRVPQNLPDGSYRAHLLVSMLETAQVIQTPAGSGEVGVGVNLKLETGVAIVGFKGEQAETKIHTVCKIEPGTGRLGLVVTNPSVWRFDGFLEFYPSNAPSTGEPLTVVRVILLRGSKNDFASSYVPPGGKGKYFIKWIDFETKAVVGSSTCDV
jgi:hypothetical protein